jgi:1-phosphofructokinase/6-phosphofructokinase 2
MTGAAEGVKPVLCIGMTPACQRIQLFECLRAGEVNRALETHVAVGGKAVNAGLALTTLGRASVVTGLIGGQTGRAIAAALAARGVACAWTRVPTPTRTCATLLERARPGVATELVEEAPPPTPEEVRRFCGNAARRLRGASMGLICGTLPPGAPPATWAELAGTARQAGVALLIDSHGAPLRQALTRAPLLAKMNAHELEKTLGAPCADEAALLAGARRLAAEGARWTLITDGPHPALLADATAAWRLTPPQIAPLNPIGSGDCVLAGCAHALLNGATAVEAARFGLGCGCANALTLRPAEFDPAQAAALAQSCLVEKIA